MESNEKSSMVTLSADFERISASQGWYCAASPTHGRAMITLIKITQPQYKTSAYDLAILFGATNQVNPSPTVGIPSYGP